MLGLGRCICVFDFDYGLEYFLVGIAAACVLFVGSGVLVLLFGGRLLLGGGDFVVALGGWFAEHFHYLFVICLVWILFLIHVYRSFAQNWLNGKVVGI